MLILTHYIYQTNDIFIFFLYASKCKNSSLRQCQKSTFNANMEKEIESREITPDNVNNAQGAQYI